MQESGGVPSVEAVRPSVTPCCDEAARPVGGNLVLHGHGVRSRSVSGLFELPASLQALEDAGWPLKETTVLVRRYRCVSCKKTMTVVPAEARPHTEVLASTVILAPGLWVLHPDEPLAGRVRGWLSPDWQTSPPGPRQLRRWASSTDLVDADVLSTRLPPKQRAAALIQILAGRSPPDTRERPLLERALAGLFAQSV